VVKRLSTSLNQQDTETVKQQMMQSLDALAAIYRENHDQTRVLRIHQLQEKLRKQELTIAFCGHFSAGKSTLINTLLGAQVLPASPVPTSANVVSIRHGKNRAVIHFKDGRRIELADVSQLNELKAYMVDGRQVETVELFYPADLLPEHVSILDTPGIDSTDEAHFLSTESALHLADVIFYVMDYNHVLSEVNFDFTRQMQEQGKHIALVVNQIDKHMEMELAFDEYRQSVKATFAQWGIHPDACFYTTLKVPDHTENQLALFQHQLRRLFHFDEKLVLESVMLAAKALNRQHLAFIHEQHAVERQALHEALAHLDGGDVQQRLEALDNRIQALIEAPQQLEQQMEREVVSLIENANLTPYPTREKAAHYLESRKPGFKAGLLFARNKTEQERERRLEALHHDLQEQAATQLAVHLKALLIGIPETYQLHDVEYASSVQELAVSWDKQRMADAVQESAVGSREYAMNYIKDLAAAIKANYRREALKRIESAAALLRQRNREQLERLNREREQFQQVISVLDKLHALDQEEAALAQQLAQHPAAPAIMPHVQLFQENAGWENEHTGDAITGFGKGLVDLAAARSGLPEQAESPLPAEESQFKERLLAFAAKARGAARLIESLQGMKTYVERLSQKARGLETQSFTVALFGAFSAGKSSFANALMGEMVLPVSPNPTTAAINQILPPTSQYPHGTVRIKLKSQEQMLADVAQALKSFDLTVEDLASAVSVVKAGHLDKDNGAEEARGSRRLNAAFLKAMASGYESLSSHLGEELSADLDLFKAFVAQEEKACYVEWIALYYDCPLTRQGIALVDTPGADSINARHTGVAFEYIKNADAVIFVTYYNHAFSRADEQFLTQLGRVKDTFEMDKMFFIVNAADLAGSEEELDGVVGHVRDNLGKLGISNPRIYAVSSQTALMAKLAQKGMLPVSAETVYRQRLGLKADDILPNAGQILAQTGFAGFERAFFNFTVGELVQMAIDGVKSEIERVVKAVGERIRIAREGEATKKQMLSDLREKMEHAENSVKQLRADVERKTLEDEIGELIYYVKQRYFYGFGGYFNESFNPAVIGGEGGALKQSFLRAMEELIQFSGFELAQEMRATSLRSEKQLHRHLRHVHERLARTVEQMFETNVLAQSEPEPVPTPDFAAQLAINREEVLPLIKVKSAKVFFEKGGREQLREALEQTMEKPVAAYLEEAKQRIIHLYTRQFDSGLERIKADALAQLAQYAEGVKSTLDEGTDIDRLHLIIRSLEAENQPL
jgi:small GTP-binding protein